jgi:hypothetical protein
MLAVMLSFGVASRLFFGWVFNRIGGLQSLLLSSAMQASEVAGTSISGCRRAPRHRHALNWLPAYRLNRPPQGAVA